MNKNLKGVDNYKTPHINYEHNIHPINFPTKLSVYFVGDYFVQKNLHSHLQWA
jgi:hypothetical protein